MSKVLIFFHTSVTLDLLLCSFPASLYTYPRCLLSICHHKLCLLHQHFVQTHSLVLFHSPVARLSFVIYFHIIYLNENWFNFECFLVQWNKGVYVWIQCWYEANVVPCCSSSHSFLAATPPWLQTPNLWWPIRAIHYLWLFSFDVLNKQKYGFIIFILGQIYYSSRCIFILIL